MRSLLRGTLTRLSVVVFRALCALRYPRDLRDRYGAEMTGDFEAMVSESLAERGVPGWLSVCLRVSRDMVAPLPGEIAVARANTEHTSGGRRVEGGERTVGTTFRGIGEDVGFAARSLRREPRFAALLVVVVAIGIALNVAVFSVVNAYLLRPLPFSDSERLVAVDGWGTVTWMETGEVFELAISWDLDAFTLVGDGRPQLVAGAWVTPDFLEAYGVTAALGRAFAADEAGPDGSSVAMISDRLWRERFGADPSVLGRTFRAYMSDRPDEAEGFTIVGVLPADFWYFNDYTEVLAPIREDRSVYTGRLRPDVSIEQAEAYLTALALGRMESPPEDFRVTLQSLHDQYVDPVRPTLVTLQIAVALVLLIACANAGVLLLVRATRREREVAVRRALGAGRLRVGRQLLAEGLLLAAAAGVLGTGLAMLAIDSGRHLVIARLGRAVPGGIETLTIDGSVLVATVVLAALVGVCFGLIPLVTVWGSKVAGALGSAARGGSDTRTRRRARSVMVIAEIALSLALLTGAGLMIRSAWSLQNRDLGFDAQGVVRGVVGLREATYPDPGDRHAFFDRFVSGVRALPGVTDAGLVAQTPFTNRFVNTNPVEGREGVGIPEAVVNVVGDGLFEALGVPLVRGRDFTTDDVEGGEPVAVVSEGLAAALWGGADPVGRGIRVLEVAMPGEPVPDPPPFRTVVGVVADIDNHLGDSGAGDLYLPYRQQASLWMNVVARAEPGAPAVLPAVEEVLSTLDSEVALSGKLDLQEAVRDALAPTRFVAGLLSGFAAFAFLLAVVGLYGVIAYAVRQSRKEIAIRMALGADRASVLKTFVASGLSVVGIGIVLGTLGGFVLGRALQDQLHDVAVGDPLIRAALALGFLGVSLLAVWLPARSAARSSPMGVLRQE